MFVDSLWVWVARWCRFMVSTQEPLEQSWNSLQSPYLGPTSDFACLEPQLAAHCELQTTQCDVKALCNALKQSAMWCKPVLVMFHASADQSVGSASMLKVEVWTCSGFGLKDHVFCAAIGCGDLKYCISNWGDDLMLVLCFSLSLLMRAIAVDDDNDANGALVVDAPQPLQKKWTVLYIWFVPDMVWVPKGTELHEALWRISACRQDTLNRWCRDDAFHFYNYDWKPAPSSTHTLHSKAP